MQTIRILPAWVSWRKILLFWHFKPEGLVILAQMQALIPWHNASDFLNHKAATYPESQAENKFLCRTGGITIKTFNEDIKPFTDFLVGASQPSAKRDETVQALAGSHGFWKHDFSIAEDSKTHEPF
ncbi:hypothetical protein J3D56_004381 [Erwinia persicina]|uniref:hypothetical protein n=1 Tax=Erwinia persicina TaxID=55211 RepID=UPI00209CC25F|nr:hypothetical protein [Erwinia persicina]MCP1440832.1 hypothetical protein [Erwinia persicina]